LVLWSVLGGCTDASPGGEAAVTSTTASGSVTTAPSSAEHTGHGAGSEESCADVHAGHQAMMWTAQMADEMLDAGCGWPYEPFMVALDGGEDDPALDAPFEARRYSELWAAISRSGLGLCSVATEVDETGDDGRAFGFDYRLGAPGGPGALPTGSVVVGEYGTEAQRDAAAHSAAGSADAEGVFVLGRWVIALQGDGAQVAPAIAGLGGQEPR
jgi:hypothetical protein